MLPLVSCASSAAVEAQPHARGVVRRLDQLGSRTEPTKLLQLDELDTLERERRLDDEGSGSGEPPPPSASPAPPPPPMAPPPSEPPVDESSSNTGAIVGGVIGGCFVPALLCILWLSGVFAKYGCPSPCKKADGGGDPQPLKALDDGGSELQTIQLTGSAKI